MSNNNPLTEIGLIVLSVAILTAMTVLLVTGKINYIEALNFLIVVAGLFGVNVAAKAPSPSQQQQLSNQQESLQQLIAQLTTSILPAMAQAHTHLEAAQVQPPIQRGISTPGAFDTTTNVQPIQIAPSSPNNATGMVAIQFAPSPLAAIQTSQMPVVPPETK